MRRTFAILLSCAAFSLAPSARGDDGLPSAEELEGLLDSMGADVTIGVMSTLVDSGLPDDALAELPTALADAQKLDAESRASVLGRAHRLAASAWFLKGEMKRARDEYLAAFE